MNLALVTSYIIAGMLMLSIIMMNLRMSNSSAELTLTQITRQHAADVADMLNDDIPNMGFNVDSKTDPILTYADEHRISFYRNLKSDPDREPELIIWEFFENEGISGVNPDYRLLTRTVYDPDTGQNSVTEIRTGVTGFQLRFYERHGENLENNMTPPPGSGPGLLNIKQIHLKLEMQSREPIYTRANSNGRYIRSVYEKRYSPRNLDLD